MTVEQIFEQILKNRGISKENREAFLNPIMTASTILFCCGYGKSGLSDYLLPTKNKKILSLWRL